MHMHLSFLKLVALLAGVGVGLFGQPAAAAEWCLGSASSDAFTDSPTTESTTDSPDASTPTLGSATPPCSTPASDLVSGRLVNGTATLPRADYLPPWINLTLARAGQRWAVAHEKLLAGSHIFGLMFVLAFPDNSAVLLFTNGSDTAEKAAKRYGSTIAQINTWYNKELKEGVEDNPLLDSLLRVRGFHAAAAAAGNERLLVEKRPLIAEELYSKVATDSKLWAAFKSDLEGSEVPERSRIVPASYEGRDGAYYSVSQWQQAMTQFAFVGFPILFPERLHITDASEEDLEAYNHLWAVLGYMLGIEDRFNVALQPDLNATRDYYRRIYEDWYLPQWFHLDEHTKILLEAQMNGFHLIEDIFTPRTLLLRMLQDIVKAETPALQAQLTPNDRQALAKFYGEGLKEYLQKIKTEGFSGLRAGAGPQAFLTQLKNLLPPRPNLPNLPNLPPLPKPKFPFQ